jgi:hypothetical protein
MTDQADTPGELVVYTTEDGLAHRQLRAVVGSVWGRQAQLADPFQTSAQAIVAVAVDKTDFAEIERLSKNGGGIK